MVLNLLVIECIIWLYKRLLVLRGLLYHSKVGGWTIGDSVVGTVAGWVSRVEVLLDTLALALADKNQLL